MFFTVIQSLNQTAYKLKRAMSQIKSYTSFSVTVCILLKINETKNISVFFDSYITLTFTFYWSNSNPICLRSDDAGHISV